MLNVTKKALFYKVSSLLSIHKHYIRISPDQLTLLCMFFDSALPPCTKSVSVPLSFTLSLVQSLSQPLSTHTVQISEPLQSHSIHSITHLHSFSLIYHQF